MENFTLTIVFMIQPYANRDLAPNVDVDKGTIGISHKLKTFECQNVWFTRYASKQSV